MTRYSLKIILLSVVLAGGSLSARAVMPVPVQPIFATVSESEPADVDRTFDTESKSTHVGRINRNLMLATVVTLTTFVLLRIALLWQISRSRKKIAQENILQPKA